MIILAGDIGGTKTTLQACKVDGNSSDIIIKQTLPSKHYSSFYDLLDEFLLPANISTNHTINVCLAVAGPIVNGKSNITNLPWVIDEEILKNKYQFNTIKIVNDFTAIGFSLPKLCEDDVVTLHSGRAKEKGTRAILGAGTGLGMCMVICENDKTTVIPSEVGNSNFAPGDEFSRELIQYMAQNNISAVYDNVLSGRGLENIYTLIQYKYNHPALKRQTEKADLAAYISDSALREDDPAAMQALEHFVKIYAISARNIALTTFSTGGLYIAGGIAPKIISKLKTNSFIETFLDNIKMHHILEMMPINIIVNSDAGLLGAIEIARTTDSNK